MAGLAPREVEKERTGLVAGKDHQCDAAMEGSREQWAKRGRVDSKHRDDDGRRRRAFLSVLAGCSHGDDKAKEQGRRRRAGTRAGEYLQVSCMAAECLALAWTRSHVCAR